MGRNLRIEAAQIFSRAFNLKTQGFSSQKKPGIQEQAVPHHKAMFSQLILDGAGLVEQEKSQETIKKSSLIAQQFDPSFYTNVNKGPVTR